MILIKIYIHLCVPSFCFFLLLEDYSTIIGPQLPYILFFAHLRKNCASRQWTSCLSKAGHPEECVKITKLTMVLPCRCVNFVASNIACLLRITEVAIWYGKWHQNSLLWCLIESARNHSVYKRPSCVNNAIPRAKHTRLIKLRERVNYSVQKKSVDKWWQNILPLPLTLCVLLVCAVDPAKESHGRGPRQDKTFLLISVRSLLLPPPVFLQSLYCTIVSN